MIKAQGIRAIDTDRKKRLGEKSPSLKYHSRIENNGGDEAGPA